jgi:hypothetical protein
MWNTVRNIRTRLIRNAPPRPQVVECVVYLLMSDHSLAEARDTRARNITTTCIVAQEKVSSLPALPHASSSDCMYLSWSTAKIQKAAGRHVRQQDLHQSLWVLYGDRPLSSAGSVPWSGGGPCSSSSRVGQLSLMPFLYLTVMHRGAGQRMTSLYKV